MRTKLIETDRPERYIHVVLNAEATATINRGRPCVLNLSSTPQPSTVVNGRAAGSQDGLQVVLPSTAGATNSNYLAYGIALTDMTPSQFGESQVHGLVLCALVNVGTRANSTTAWATLASIGSGGFLTVDTTNNCLVSSGGLSAGVQHFILIDSIGSIASSASTSTDTRVVYLQACRVFVRQM